MRDTMSPPKEIYRGKGFLALTVSGRVCSGSGGIGRELSTHHIQEAEKVNQTWGETVLGEHLTPARLQVLKVS